jgi:hypothetical protein
MVLGVFAAFGLVVGGPAPAQQDPAPPPAASGRQWLVPVPAGCTVPALPDVVFVGTLLETGTPAGAPAETANETARFRIDQARAGDVGRYSYNGVIDVRYGIDAKYLDGGEQYLIGASVDPAAGVLVSKLRPAEPAFGGDDVIGAAERDVVCPTVDDPIRTTHVDGTAVDDSVLGPLLSTKGRLLRSFAIPFAIVFGILFALVALRWLLTGVFKGVGSVVRTASEPREVRAAMRTRPNVTREFEDATRL